MFHEIYGGRDEPDGEVYRFPPAGESNLERSDAAAAMTAPCGFGMDRTKK
jgi:hypothetical protein